MGSNEFIRNLEAKIQDKEDERRRLNEVIAAMPYCPSAQGRTGRR